ncbi:MAG: GntR family transcriptional regulator, partial [Oscillospiraceae bacterium]
HKVPSSKIIKIVKQPASERDIRELNLSQGEQVIYLLRLLFADGEPVMVEHNFFPERFSKLLETNLEDTSLYAFLREQYGIHFGGGAFKSIQIAEPTELEAELLNIPISTPMMMIREIVYSSADEPIHRTKQYLLGDRFKYVIPKK